MKVISISNFKGGVGKTLVTRNLAQELARRGKSVLAIDMDHQCNLSELMFTPDGACVADEVEQQQRSISNVLIPEFCATGELSLREAVYETSVEGIDFVPADFNFRRANDTTLANPFKLKKHIKALEKDGGKAYDVVLIDTRPELDRKTTLSYVASDYVIIPVVYNRHLIRGLDATLDSINGAVSEYDLDLAVKVLPNMIKTNNRVDRSGAEALASYLGENSGLMFGTSVHYAAVLNEAGVNGTAACDYNADSRAAQEFAAVADELDAWMGVA